MEINKKDIIYKISKIADVLLSIVFPAQCFVCQDIIPKDESNKHLLLCPACEEALYVINPPLCIKCGDSVSSDGMVCDRCRYVDGWIYEWVKCNHSFVYYDDITKVLIHNLKYYGHRECAEGLVNMAFDKISTEFMSEIDLIIPVPLHKSRYEERGYNQAEDIADAIGRRTGLPVATDILKRTHSTSKQSFLNYSQRRKNIEDAFNTENSEKISGKSVLLVDDIYTSGSTLSECAKTLSRAGTGCVITFTLAKTFKEQVS